MSKSKWFLKFIESVLIVLMAYLLITCSFKIQKQQQLIEKNELELVSLEKELKDTKDSILFFEELMFFLNERVKVLEASIFDNDKTA